MICYPAVIEYDREDNAYNVSFPDLPGCLTFGNTIDDAKENAKEGKRPPNRTLPSLK